MLRFPLPAGTVAVLLLSLLDNKLVLLLDAAIKLSLLFVFSLLFII